jgi:threonine/homoserine/homoserine lactone efflux protein
VRLSAALPVAPERLVLFLGLMTVLALTPGPAVLFSIANGVHRGARGVLLGVLGITLASAVWFLGAGLGLGALMAAAPWLFTVLAWFGIAYLLWLGGGKLWAGLKGDAHGPEGARLRPGRAALADGFAVQVANPKVVLFFSSVLPPFLDRERPLPPQLLVFAVVALGTDFVGLSSYGLGGAALADRLRSPSGARAFALASGALLIGAAILIAMSRS